MFWNLNFYHFVLFFHRWSKWIDSTKTKMFYLREDFMNMDNTIDYFRLWPDDNNDNKRPGRKRRKEMLWCQSRREFYFGWSKTSNKTWREWNEKNFILFLFATKPKEAITKLEYNNNNNRTKWWIYIYWFEKEKAIYALIILFV